MASNVLYGYRKDGTRTRIEHQDQGAQTVDGKKVWTSVFTFDGEPHPSHVPQMDVDPKKAGAWRMEADAAFLASLGFEEVLFDGGGKLFDFTWTPTLELRWFGPEDEGHAMVVLQQKFIQHSTGKTEWRNIERVTS